MPADTSTLNLVLTIISVLFGTGGIVSLFKVRAEKGHILTQSTKEIVEASSAVRKDLREDYDRLSDELAEVRMSNISLEKEHDACTKKIFELQASVNFLQRDLDRHGRMAELARRKSHVALHAIGGYELLIDDILVEMRNNNVPIPPTLRPHKLRQALQAEMDKIDELESVVVEQAVKAESPETPNDATI